MNTEELTVGDLIFLPVGSVVEFLEPNGEPRYYETTKRKDRLWDCTFCPANHTSRDIASFKMKMRLKKMGDPEVGETITSEQVGVASHFPIGTRLQDVDKSEDMYWQRVEGGWFYDPEDFFENPDRTPTKSLNEDYAPYTVLPKAEVKEAELPRLNEKGDAPEKTEFTAAEASRMRGVIFEDNDGDFWKNFDGYWKYISAEYPKYLHLWEIPSSTLSPDHEPYTFLGYKDDDLAGENEIPRFAKNQEKPKKAGLIDAFETSVLSSLTATPAIEYHFSTDAGPAFSEEVTSLFRNEDIEVEKTEGLTVEDLLKRPDRLYYDSEGDLWGCRDGKWAWGETLEGLVRKLSIFQHDEPLGGGVEPYRVAEGMSLPEPEPEEEKAPTITELFTSLVNSLERIAKELEEK
ncbi:MAG: hypothetical protein PHW63_07705 [Alphaproteobacteria bacterium]|nr:hypothetical protein [Alphaproteobacteria bacterium]